MLKGMKDLAGMFKQAQQLGSRLQEMTDELKQKRTEGTAGGGMVTVEINGAQEILNVQIDPKLVEDGDRELIEDLVVAATNQAITKARQMHADAMKELSGGFQLPGLEEALGKMTGSDNPSDDERPDEGDRGPLA